MTAITSIAEPSVAYHPSKIGSPGKPWGVEEYKLWRETRPKQRCYFADLAPRIRALGDITCSQTKAKLFEVVQYGELPHHDGDADQLTGLAADSSGFPLYAVRSADWSSEKRNVFITGGVHGYETSGVEGAILFLTSGRAAHYARHFNVLVAPCVSPWGYERIQRWTAKGTDPNRSFNPDGEVVEGRSFNPEAATDESTALIRFLRKDMGHVEEWTCHLDLHETTDTDETEFRPAKLARDGIVDDGEKGEIPDGFYLVQDETSPTPEWFTAMIESVRKVTHIAPADADGKIIGESLSQEGVISIPCKKSLGLCAGVTNAPYRTTTEVYPDSPSASPEQCNRAQVACIEGALDHLLSVL
eukprot:CAMPEP_0172574954 /NCGR_PEP_ID=MMETSP1067-20121228/136963_1 /TAXON_ID=265564 ORGANISM="Thalassiosira punctigera, Strain Tpunct2005C2" /NCGR_SAMPLE_ID=MMETSP1067 /ASSEMBLY_ACC=CAM_ASM_000444 /LENGTH=357 /DNA_ID=CAMNT_0013367593 /DNA_START=137 /DNA_END=1210 /DNA_ORIENTATION=-